MIKGPIPLRAIAAFLGKREHDILDVLKADKIPNLTLTSGKLPEVRVYLMPLLEWVNKRNEHAPMTAEQLSAELERCIDAHKALDAKKNAKRKAKVQA